MSSVTRLHLLSQSMLNVSCQKQKHCSSFPADSPAESPMEFIGQQRVAVPCNLLRVPGLSILDTDDDECDVVINIRPKSSPLPRRRSSDSDDDFGPELSGSRRVSFADAKGLSLVQVKEFDTSDVPKLPECDPSEGLSTGAEEYFLSPFTFFLPLSTEDLLDKVREQKVELETINILPGTTILKGVIRVLNISFNKVVYVRTSLDTWASHFDLLAEYEPSCSDSLTDRFSFKLTLVPPFGEQGARVDFCLRYETPVGTFWANNNNRNYVLFCHQREKKRKESPQKEKVNKKSCLKTVSQDIFTVENVSVTEVSSPENISAEHGEETNTVKARPISNGQSGTLEDNPQTSNNENRLNCSRRRHRKAARMARVKDFSQRNGGPNGADRDESPPKANQTAKEEAHSDVASFPEGSSKSEDSHFVDESLGTCNEPLLDVLHDTSLAHDSMSNSKPEKSESIRLADSATLTAGERAADIPGNPSNDEPAPPGGKYINRSVSKAEESSQNPSMTCECGINIAAEPANSGISTVSSESLVNQTNSFTFGTVVAPLYHQVSGRVMSENPAQATQHVGDLTQRYPRITRGSVVPTDDQIHDGKILGNVIPTPDPDKDCLNAPANSPPMKQEETSLSVTVNNIASHAVTLQNPDDVTDSDQTSTNSSEVPEADIQPNTVKNLNDDLLNPQIAIESFHGEVQEDNLTHDLQLPVHTCTPTNTDLDETQSETQEIMSSLTVSPQPPQSTSECVSDETVQQTHSCVHESNKDNYVGNTSILAKLYISTATSEKDNPLESVHDLNPECNDNSAARESEISCASCFEIVQEQDVITPHVSLENNHVEEGNEVVNNKNDQKKDHKHGDIVVELKDEDIREIKPLEAESAVAEQEGFCLETTEVNWEMMVEEEEKNILTEEDECEEVDLEAVGKDQDQLEDAGRETTSENSDMTEVEKEDEAVCEFAAAKEKENKSEGEDVLDSKELIGEGGNGEIVVGKDREAVEKELQDIQATKTAAEEEQAEEIELRTSEEQEDSELEKENLFEKQPTLEKTNVHDGEELEGEEGMETDLKDNSEAGVEWKDQIKSMAVNVEEENPDVEDEIVETSEIPDAESESVITDNREERLDITQNTVEDGLSAPVKDVQDQSLIHAENGHITAEMQTVFQSSQYDQSDAKQEEEKPIATEGGWCIFTDEPENDQTSHDSSSAESDSDDEMELYMHCLRAVHTGAQAQVDKSKDAGFGVGKLKHSTSRSKLLSSPMPSISESLDEEHLSCLPVGHEDMETTSVQPAHTGLVSSEQTSNNANSLWWKETFSCSKISNALLYATLLVVFLVVAYHYDFLACFGLYLVSVVWLYCQG